MCGRYALYSDIRQLRGYFPIDPVECEFKPNYNVALTKEVPAIVSQDERIVPISCTGVLSLSGQRT